MSGLRMIVINDDDGHTTVIVETFHNLRKCLEMVLEYNSRNTCLEDDGEKGRELLMRDIFSSAEDTRNYLRQYGPAGRGLPLSFVEAVEVWDDRLHRIG